MSSVTDILALRFVKSILCNKDITTFGKIDFIHILPGMAKDVYAWIVDYQLKVGILPTEQAVQDEFGKILPTDIEDANYLLGKLIDRQLTNVLSKGLQKVADHLDKNDPHTAFAELEKLKPTIPKVVQVSSYVKEALSRVTSYEAAVAGVVFEGIKTPWEELNVAIQGWMNGTLNIVLARAGIGKTWSLCITAVDCLLKDKKVLLVTLEMPTSRIHRRLDSLRHKFSFGKLRNVNLHPDDVIRWKDEIAASTCTGDILVVDKKTVRTVADVNHLVKQHSPDIVLVDGGYRFQGKGSGWEATVSIVNDLQLFAEASNVPWIVTNQYGDASDSGKEAGKTDKLGKMVMWNTRYGKEWVINPDIVIGLQQFPEDRILKKMQVHIMKTRDADAESSTDMFYINWDLISSTFTSTSSTHLTAIT